MTETHEKQQTRDKSDKSAEGDAEVKPVNVRTTVWMDAGHLPGPLPEGIVPQDGKVLVYADDGEVVAEQPDLKQVKEDYATQTEEAARAAGEAAQSDTAAVSGPRPEATTKR